MYKTMHIKIILIIAVMLHGDNQYNPKYIKKMLEKLINNKSIAAVSGSRMFHKKMH